MMNRKMDIIVGKLNEKAELWMHIDIKQCK